MAVSPERIGRYAVQEVIGAGGFATVYRATDERLEVDVAVKVLAENHSIDPEVRERFIEEGRRLRRVHSPHLLEVYDLGDTERAQPYLVLSWADRGDLARRVADAPSRGYGPTVDDALVVARALTDALAALHRNQLVHRDLAPKNILLSSSVSAAGLGPGPPGAGLVGRQPGGLIAPDEQIVLADLGMSKDLARASGLTVAAGTSGFAPPEQREAGGTVDRRADIWAASALIVWLALGEAPGDDGPWKRLREGPWPPDLVPVLERGLSPAPGDRQPTIESWLAELEEASRPVPPPPAPAPPGDGVTSTAARRRARAVVVSALVVGLLAGGISGYAVAGGWSDGTSARTETLEGGRERSVVEQRGIRVAIEGPGTVSVGDAVSLGAQVTGAESWAWVAPNGELHPGAPELTFTTRTAGTVTVRLLAFDEGGRLVELDHDLVVTDG